MRGRDKAKKFDLLIKIIVSFWSFFPRKFLYRFLELNRNLPGYLGLGIRYTLLKVLCKSCGDNVFIGPGVYFYKLENLIVGNNVSFHPLCYIDATGGVEIKDNVSIAHNCSIISFEHDYTPGTIFRDNLEILKSVKVGSNVWLGAGVRVLSGAIIENNVVIGAGSIVKGIINKNSLYVGVPARKIKEI
ncbi:UNVERIFIED_ORG: acetyltransferase-like isoleucine patch superfamily enzyme [Peribacillus simplex]